MFKNDTATLLSIAGTIKNLLETRLKREEMLATPMADDMIYCVPGSLCVDMDEGKPVSKGALYVKPLPAGLRFTNGAGAKAVRMSRRVALHAENQRSEECIAMFVKQLLAKD
jgi:hypothetical protein